MGPPPKSARPGTPPGPPGDPPRGPPKPDPPGTPGPGTPGTGPHPRVKTTPPTRAPTTSVSLDAPHEPWSGHDRFARSHSIQSGVNITFYSLFFI
jgi:hypothetical protein